MQISGKVAIVTGGGSGIARAMCLRLGELGARVVVADRNLEAAQDGNCGLPPEGKMIKGL
ncbi:MAG: SDR family NAD(P)-dependent oxidoreductase [Vulcanimicrobiota bacterium]